MKKLIIAFVLIIVLLGIAVMAAPTALSTGWGNKQLLALVNARIPGTFHADRITLGWFSGIQVESGSLLAPDKEEIAHFTTLSYDRPLYQLFLKTPLQGRLHLERLTGVFTKNGNGTSNLQRALGRTGSINHNPFSPVSFADLSVLCNISQSAEHITCSASGRASQGQMQGRLSLETTLSGFNSNEDDRKSEAKLAVQIESFPIAFFDVLQEAIWPNREQMLSEFIGPLLTVKTNELSKEDRRATQLVIQSQKLNGTLTGSLQNHMLILDKPSSLTWSVSDKARAQINCLLPGLKISRIADVRLSIQQMQLPIISIEEGRLYPELMAIDATLQMEDVHLQGRELGSPLSISQLNAAIQTDHDRKTAEVTITANAHYQEKVADFKIMSIIDIPDDTDHFFEEILQQIDLRVQAKSLPLDLLSAHIANEALGPSLDIDLALKKQNGEGSLIIDAETENLYFKQMRFSLDDRIVLQHPVEIHISLNPKLFLVKKNSSLILKLDELTIDEKELLKQRFDTLFLQGSFLAHNQIISKDSYPELDVQEVNGIYSGNPLKDGLKIEATSQIALRHIPRINSVFPLFMQGMIGIKEGALWVKEGRASISFTPVEVEALLSSDNILDKGEATISAESAAGLPSFSFDAAWQIESSLTLSGTFNELPIKDIEHMLPESMIFPFPRELVSGKVKGKAVKKKEWLGEFAIDLHTTDNPGKDSQLSMRVLLEKDCLVFSGHADLIVMIDPERFLKVRKALMPKREIKPVIALQEETSIRAVIDRFIVPVQLTGQQPLIGADASIVGSIHTNPFKLYDSMQNQSLAFDRLDADISTSNLEKEVNFSLTSIRDKGRRELYAKGRIADLLNHAGRIDLDGAFIAFEAKGDDLPVTLLGNLFMLDPSLTKKGEIAFGDSVGVEIQVSLQQRQGHFFADINGEKGTLSLDGSIRNGMLTLNRPFVAVFKATKGFGRYVLADTLPLFHSMTAAENPIRVEVDPKGFSFPIISLAYDQIQVGFAKIDLGKMHFTEEGQIAHIASLFQSRLPGEIPVWFTPLYFSVKDGVIHVERMDMLFLHRYPVAIWGTIHLPKDTISMNIGISGKALALAKGIAVDDNYMMVIPYKGSTDRASIDQIKVSGQIASLFAKSSGSIEGMIAGSILDIAIGGKGKIPPPTTRPLPWEGELPASPKPEKKSAEPSAGKKLKDGAKNLIKNIFK